MKNASGIFIVTVYLLIIAVSVAVGLSDKSSRNSEEYVSDALSGYDDFEIKEYIRDSHYYDELIFDMYDSGAMEEYLEDRDYLVFRDGTFFDYYIDYTRELIETDPEIIEDLLAGCGYMMIPVDEVEP